MTYAALQEIVCGMGQPIAGNPTQFMFERAFEAAGLDWRYLSLEVPPEALGDAVRGLKAMGFRGGNFTIPHKVAVLPLLDELTQAAELMGAVNCVTVERGKLVGENTDGKGFVQSLRTLTDPKGKRIVLFGAGGAARAIAVELALSGVGHITLVNRHEARGNELAKLIAERLKTPIEFVPWQGGYSLDGAAEIVVNATSVGLGDPHARVAIDASSWKAGMVAADVVFNPAQTVFLREAAERGCATLDGLGMLVNQAVIAFKIWTGEDPDNQEMREALEEYLEL